MTFLLGFTVEEIQYDPKFCKDVLTQVDMIYDSVFIEEFLEMKFIHGIELLK